MNKIIITSASFALSLGLAITGCAVEPELQVGDDTGYLFGLGQDDMLQVHAVAPERIDAKEWLAMNRAPFDCGNYGTLCVDVGEEAAYDIIESGYLMALEGADIDEINAHQWGAIREAELAWEYVQDNEMTLKATSTRYYYGGSNNKRLKIIAKAIELWPSGDFKSSANCRTQKKVLGVWGSMNSDSISGTRSATFSGSGGYTNTVSRSVSSDNLLEFPDRTDTANSLTTNVSCEAENGAWGASGSASAYQS